MVAEPRSLYPDEVAVSTAPGKGEHGYYKRPDNGWVVTAPVWTSFRNDMEYKGLRYLPQYGAAPLDMPGNKTTRDVNGRLFSTVEEPWRLIFQKGGAHEFPVSQIIAHRWHIRPPYREVVFPQMEGVKVYDLFCPECEGIFSSDFEQDAIEQLRVHLTSRVNDSHSYRPEDLRALGEEYGVDFFAPRRVRMARQKQVTEESYIETPDMTPEQTIYRCNDCGYETDSRVERMQHGKVCPAKGNTNG